MIVVFGGIIKLLDSCFIFLKIFDKGYKLILKQKHDTNLTDYRKGLEGRRHEKKEIQGRTPRSSIVT